MTLRRLCPVSVAVAVADQDRTSNNQTDASHLASVIELATLLLTVRLAGLVVKVSASRVEDPGFESRLRRDFFGSSHNGDLKLAFQWLPCQAPDVIGSVLGLVGPVSVYCDWVR